MTVKKEFASFDHMIADSDLPVLVDFYATWCGPCQMMAKMLVQVKTQLGENLRIVKIDTDKYPQIASQHQVSALPTLMLFKQGQSVDRIEGVLPIDQLMQRLRSHL